MISGLDSLKTVLNGLLMKIDNDRPFYTGKKIVEETRTTTFAVQPMDSFYEKLYENRQSASYVIEGRECQFFRDVDAPEGFLEWEVADGTDIYPIVIILGTEEIVLGPLAWTITVRTETEVIHKMDAKYLPESLNSADWNQNDENGIGYVKNRTHSYVGEERLLSSQVYDISCDLGGYYRLEYPGSYSSSKDPIGADYCRVVYDGVEYRLPVGQTSLERLVGNPSILNFSGGYVEDVKKLCEWLAKYPECMSAPFLLKWETYYENFTQVYSLEPGEHTIEVYGIYGTFNTIDERFIPKYFAKGPDFSASLRRYANCYSKNADNLSTYVKTMEWEDGYNPQGMDIVDVYFEYDITGYPYVLKINGVEGEITDDVGGQIPDGFIRAGTVLTVRFDYNRWVVIGAYNRENLSAPISQLSTEEWTFTLEDGSTVTKKVVVST